MMGMAVAMMVKIISGKVEMGIISDQTDLPALSITFCWRLRVSGDSAVGTASKLTFREISTLIFSDRTLVR